jgi:threonine dehydratase
VQKKITLPGKKVALVVAGGNIDATFLSRIIERGLVKDGRLVRYRLRVPDHAGALARLTGVLAAQLANIIEITHDRAYYGVNLGDSVVEVTLETRGPEHIAELVKAMDEAGYRAERVM